MTLQQAQQVIYKYAEAYLYDLLYRASFSPEGVEEIYASQIKELGDALMTCVEEGYPK